MSDLSAEHVQSLSQLTAAGCYIATRTSEDPSAIKKMRSIATQLNTLAPALSPRAASKVVLMAETLVAICRAEEQREQWQPECTTAFLIEWRRELFRLAREIRARLPN